MYNAKIKFIIISILIEIIYLSFFLIEPLRKYYGDLGIVSRNNKLFYIITCLLLINLFLYFLGYKLVKKNVINIKIIIYFFILFNFTLLFLWPITSNDIFSYLGRARVLSEHGKNPYLVSYNTFTNDDFYNLIKNKWLSQLTPYGPIFTIISAGLAYIGKFFNLIINLFIFKIFFIAINILNLYIIHKTLKNKLSTYLYAFNPLILFEFAVNGHNDVLTVFFLLLSFYFLLNNNEKIKNYLFSFVFLLLSALIKYMTIILLPLYFIIIIFIIKKRKSKILFALLSLLSTIIILFIFYLPFSLKTNIFYTPILNLFSNINNEPSYIIMLPPIITAIIFSLSIIVKNISYSISFLYSRIIFIIFYLFSLVRLLFNRNNIIKEDIIKYSFYIMLIFLLTFFNWVLPWYYTLLIVLAIYFSKIKNFKYDNIIFIISFISIIYYFVLR